jgi:hypothetical protein
MERSNDDNNNNNNNPPRFQLDRIAFYGRTLSEYLRMFGIDDIASWRNILVALQVLPHL